MYEAYHLLRIEDNACVFAVSGKNSQKIFREHCFYVTGN